MPTPSPRLPRRIAGFALAVALLWVDPAWAVIEPFEGGLYLGPVEAHAEFDLRTAWESNVFHLSDQAHGDLSTGVDPGLTVRYEPARGAFEANAGYEYLRYHGLVTPVTRRQTTQTWFAGAEGTYDLLSGTKLSGSGLFKDTTEPLYSDSTLSRERLRRRHSEANARIGQTVGVGLVESEVQYLYVQDHYVDAPRFDRITHGVELEMKLRTFPTLGLFGRAGYHRTFRPRSEDRRISPQMDVVRTVFGVTGKPSPLYEVLAYLGGQYRRFGAGDVRDVRPLATVQLTYRPSAVSTWQAQYQYESLDGTITDELVIHRGMASYERALGRAFDVSAKARLWQTRFAHPGVRRDLNHQSRVQVGYAPVGSPWLDVSWGYEFTWRNSTEPDLDFNDHTAFVLLALNY